jgi:hypothetical protein
LHRGILGDLATLIRLGLLLILLHLELLLAGEDVLRLDLVVLLALDAVRHLAVGLNALGDRAEALGVEDVLRVELFDGEHRERGDAHVLEREAVLLQLFAQHLLDALGELLSVGVERHEGLVRRHAAERVGELALDEVRDDVLVEVAFAERARRREDVLGDRAPP